MITSALKVFWTERASFIAVLIFACLLTAAKAETTETSGPPSTSGNREDRRNKNGDNHRRDWDGRDGHEGRGDRHYNPEEFRQQMKVELEKIPSLNKRMGRLMDIQSERYKLQSRRRNVATEQSKDRGAVVKQFHELLRRDMELSEESRKIVQEIVKDMGAIQKELATRRDQLQYQIDQENSRTANQQTSTTEAKNHRRSQRYLDFLEKKLKDLETHPDRLDLLSRMLRGIPFDDSPLADDATAADLTPEERMPELRIKRRHLQRQLRQVENDIEALEAKGIKNPDSKREKTGPSNLP